MAVIGLDLHLADPGRAATLFLDLLGGDATTDVGVESHDLADHAGPAAGPAGDGGHGTSHGARWSGPDDRGTTITWSDGGPSRAIPQVLAVAVADPSTAIAAITATGATVTDRPDGWQVQSDVLGIDVVVARTPATPPHVPPQDNLPPHEGTPHEDLPAPTARGTASTTRFDHVCLAVTSLADAVRLLCDQLGGRVVFGGHNAAMGTLSSQVAFGDGTRVEVLQPVRDDALLAGFLRHHGPGLHHLTWYVVDVAAAVGAATALGFEVVGTDLVGRTHWRETYLRPRSTQGLLVQLAWTDRHHDQPLDHATVSAILAGDVTSWDHTMHHRTPGHHPVPGVDPSPDRP